MRLAPHIRNFSPNLGLIGRPDLVSVLTATFFIIREAKSPYKAIFLSSFSISVMASAMSSRSVRCSLVYSSGFSPLDFFIPRAFFLILKSRLVLRAVWTLLEARFMPLSTTPPVPLVFSNESESSSVSIPSSSDEVSISL